MLGGGLSPLFSDGTRPCAGARMKIFKFLVGLVWASGALAHEGHHHPKPFPLDDYKITLPRVEEKQRAQNFLGPKWRCVRVGLDQEKIALLRVTISLDRKPLCPK